MSFMRDADGVRLDTLHLSPAGLEAWLLGEIADTSSDIYLALASTFGSGIGGAFPTNINLIGYGHSYVLGSGASDQAHRYLERLGVLLQAANVINRGVAGESMSQTLRRVITGTNQWVAGTHGLVDVHSVLNNVLHGTVANTAQIRTGFNNALRTILRLLRTTAYRDETHGSITYSAGWGGAGPLTGTRSGTAKLTGTNGETATIGGYADTEITIMAIAFSNSGETTFDVSVGGTVYGGPFSTSSGAETSDVAGQGYQVNSYRVTGMPAGSKSVVVTNRATHNLYFCGYALPASDSPPSILVMQDIPLPVYTGSAYTKAQADAALANLNADITSIVAESEFGGADFVRKCDASVGFNTGTMLAADTWHPNDAGHEVIAQDAKTAALLFPNRAGLR